ncbi:CST complex subunit CTC1 [Oryzias melastigma]|uniref:CST complex subunit CTC1 n=1 Tax=Oryzias melastigma TaxID=30732 RepID=A0A834FJY8_ORYME|nr:CST complex subunit CTC1 [Oryzias melastigma]
MPAPFSNKVSFRIFPIRTGALCGASDYMSFAPAPSQEITASPDEAVVSSSDRLLPEGEEKGHIEKPMRDSSTMTEEPPGPLDVSSSSSTLEVVSGCSPPSNSQSSQSDPEHDASGDSSPGLPPTQTPRGHPLLPPPYTVSPPPPYTASPPPPYTVSPPPPYTLSPPPPYTVYSRYLQVNYCHVLVCSVSGKPAPGHRRVIIRILKFSPDLQKFIKVLRFCYQDYLLVQRNPVPVRSGEHGLGAEVLGEVRTQERGGTRFRSDPENMDSEHRFLERFGPRSEAERAWLKNIFLFIGRYLSPCCSDPAPSTAEGSLTGVEQLSIRLVLEIQQRSSVDHSLPVSYRLLSVSELVSQQNLACVSNLSWTTNQHRAWAKEAELSLPGQQAPPRVNLLLIGCLTKGRGGDWRLMDSSGSVRCEVLSPSPLWMNLPVFLPDWNYIPHDASGQDVEIGHLELIGCPVFLCPEAEHGLAAAADGAELEAVPVSEAGVFLQNRVRGQRVSVHGQVCSVCPLLDVSGTPFFCFSLTDGESSLPVLVQEPSRLWWRTCVHVGRSVCVTSLRVSVLRGWRGNNILCVTERSQLHTDYTHTQTHTPDTHPETDTPLLMSHDCEEEEPDVNQSGVRMKRSRIISYQGTVTEVVSEGAGLYVLDRKLGLCVAYQPASRRSLRVGDGVELHHVHFLFRPCPDFPPSMLCTCLRSSVTVTSFSRVDVSDSAPRCPGDGVLSRLLLQKHMGVSEYLWACHLSSQLSISLVPAVMKQQCVCLLSWKMMKTLRGRRAPTRRDIYCEMLDQPHTCPLSQVRLRTPVRMQEERCHGNAPSFTHGVIAVMFTSAYGVRLTLCDLTGRSVRVYLDLSHAPYPPGLLPGSIVLLSDFQRKVSRSGGVYFTNLPVSSMTVMSLVAESLAPPHPPMMHLGQWGVKGQKENVTGLVRGHVVCFLFLQLQWSCSTCSSVYTQVCSSQCGSSSAVFRSRAKLVIDDGTGEAHVWVSGVVVQTLLGLADFQWVGLQRWLKVKGHLRVLPGGRSLVCDSEEPLLHFLLSMCSSEAVRRPVCLTCRRHAPSRAPDLRRFSRADRDFITRMTPPLQLTCVHLHS